MAKPLPAYTALGDTPTPRPPAGVAHIDTGPLTSELGYDRSMIATGGLLEEASTQLDAINTLKAESAFNQLRSKQLDLTSGPNGFLNTKGGDAIDPDFYPSATSRFDDAQKEVADTLTNNRQRQLFNERARIAQLQYKEHLLGHIQRENDTFQTQTNQAVISTEVQNIAANYTDPNAVGISNTRIAAAIDREAQRLGWSKEQKDLAGQKAQDAAWSARLNAQMVTDPVGALKAFDETGKEQMSPQLRETMLRQLKIAALPVEAKNAATTIISGEGMNLLRDGLQNGGQDAVDQVIAAGNSIAPAGTVNPGGPGLPGLPATGSKYDIKAGLMGWVQQAEEVAQKQHPDDPVYRDLVVQNVKSYMNTLVAAQDGIARQAHAALMTAATGQPGQSAPLTLDQLLTTPELKRAWNVSDPAGQRGILALLEHNARAAQGTPIRSNAIVVTDLFQRINLPDEDARKIRTPGQLAPYFGHGINRADYDWLKKTIDDLQTPDGQHLSEVRNKFFAAANAQFDGSTMLNIDAKGKEDAYKFWQYATEQERQARVAGRDPYALYNPASPDYLGKKIPAFQRSLEQQIRDLSDSISRGQGPTPPAGTTQPQPPVPAAPFAAAPAPMFEVGKTYTFKQGRFKYKGGPTNDPKSFEAVK